MGKVKRRALNADPSPGTEHTSRPCGPEPVIQLRGAPDKLMQEVPGEKWEGVKEDRGQRGRAGWRQAGLIMKLANVWLYQA